MCLQMMSNGSAEMTSLTSVSGGIKKPKKVSMVTFPASAGEDIEKLKKSFDIDLSGSSPERAPKTLWSCGA